MPNADLDSSTMVLFRLPPDAVPDDYSQAFSIENPSMSLAASIFPELDKH
jgi:hypothetical protein